MNGSTRSYEMAKRLVAAGHEVHIFTSCRTGLKAKHGWQKEKIDGINVHWIHIPYDNTFGFAKRLLAFITFALRTTARSISEKGDIVFATSTPLTIAIPAIIAKKKLRIPLTFEVRDLWPELPIAIGALRSRILIFFARQLEKWAYKNSDVLIGLSPGMCDGITKHGIDQSSVHCIPNSCDIEIFQVESDEGTKFRAQHPWLGDKPLVVYAGTLGVLNGVTYLAEIAKEMLTINPDVRFLVVGDGSEKGKIIARARHLDVLERNFFMLPPQPKNQIPALYNAATLVTSLFVPVREMWSNSANKFFDGLAAGRPIAINYGGWQTDILKCQKNGIILDPMNHQKSARLINRTIGDPVLIDSMGQKSLALAKNRYSRDRMADALQAALVQASMKT